MTRPETVDPTRIDLDQFYPHPPEKVWHALTAPDLMAQWLMRPDGFEARVGRRFSFRARPIPASDFSGEIVCEVLEATPPHRLSYTWEDPHRERPTGWVISWELVPEGHGTRLVFRHTGFDPDDALLQRARTIMGGGWPRILDALGPVLDSEAGAAG